VHFIADFHIHSHYSRATSKEARPEELYRWAVYKGVTLVGTGDFTHPAWREELKEKLEPAEEGLYRLKDEFRRQLEEAEGPEGPLPVLAPDAPVRFVVSGEISTIYKKDGRVRKVHHLLLLPDLEAAEELSRQLEAIGNLASDGRPILGLDSRRLLEITLEVCPRALFIPAHIWTPHFSLLGANSGFDHIEECFEDLTGYIHAVETGLSSDPPMNWRLSMLDRLALVSHSDAHSPRHLAREADILDTDLSYEGIYRALADPGHPGLVGTLEFFPEEGKYHYDGHRACNIRWRPSQTREAGGVCPVCGRKVTVGVLHRVEELADRGEGLRPPGAKDYESLVPLPEAIASALGVGVASKQVWQRYFSLLRRLGPELVVLRQAPLEEIARVAGSLVAEAVGRVRAGRVEVLPGFDGEYGKIILLAPEERVAFCGQPVLFEESRPGSAPGTGDRKKTGGNPAEAPGDRAAPRPQPASAAFPGILPEPADRREDDLLAGLNHQQRAAVTAEEGPVIVIAGPGTGKTKTLVHRIAYLLGPRGADPGQITAVTFTNRAATEIRRRVAELTGGAPGIEALTVGTFHGICMEILRNYGVNNPGGIPVVKGEVTLLDEVDARAVLEEILKEVPGSGRRDVQKIQQRISLFKSRGLTPSSEEIPEDLRTIYKAYQHRMEEYGALDYDDVLLKALELGKSCPGVYGRRFTHLLVDEFQDVNAVQYELVKLWAGKGENLFVIGDPDQAIYGFRGADHRFFRKLREDFPQALILRLSLNYRSTPVILRAASSVVGHRGEGLVAVRKGGPKIRHLEVPGETAEGIAILREIGRLVGGTSMLQAHGQYGGLPGEEGGEFPENLGFGDIAVLFRTGLQGEALEECFLKEGIPYRVVGRESFLEDRAVRKVLAFFRCVVNLEDDFHLYRLLRTEPWKLDERQLRNLREAAVRTGKPVWQVIEEDWAGVKTELRALRKGLEVYRALAAKESPAVLVSRWMEEYEAGAPEPLGRLLRVASGFRDLSSFLWGIGAVREGDHERRGENAASPEAVTLMTLHAAKGLEFPVVFIAGVEDGLIPLRGGEDLSEEALEEERRLFYVGLTRAREVLFLVTARRRSLFGGSTPTQPSPFLRDIPPDCLDRRQWTGRPARRQDREGPFRQLTLF